MNLSNLVKRVDLRSAKAALLALALGVALLWSVTAQAQTNNAATGAPTITGLPRVGVELTADTSAIMDADGTAMATFTYQWVRVDGMTETNIGTDSSAYTLTADDEGKQVRVDVTFTDDAGNPEGPLPSEGYRRRRPSRRPGQEHGATALSKLRQDGT